MNLPRPLLLLILCLSVACGRCASPVRDKEGVQFIDCEAFLDVLK